MVKGIHYGPWRPGTGPGKQYLYPSASAIREDFRLIQQMNANTVLVFDPPGYLLDLAHEYGLKVLYTFALDWWSIGTEGSNPSTDILARVREHRTKPALLAWLLGNEIPANALAQRRETIIVDALRELYVSIKSVDPNHPITHSSWPPVRDLDLSFLDFASFNVYPLWPPEVAARGYEGYLRELLQPIAGSKPLLITELGVSSLEVGHDAQARLLTNAWNSLLRAGAAGGVIFEFADEWWKNYDNPVRPPGWWDRRPDPDDEREHDQDPEEHYGVVNAARQPKPAFAAVRDMFSDQTSTRTIPIFVCSLLVLTAVVAWLRARRPVRRHPRADSATGSSRSQIGIM